jgi:hypothetical protein
MGKCVQAIRVLLLMLISSALSAETVETQAVTRATLQETAHLDGVIEAVQRVPYPPRPAVRWWSCPLMWMILLPPVI